MNLKAQSSEMTQQTIIKTAISVLGTEGYAALTVSKLSKQAGISKGALYHHFDSLEAVRLRALERLISDVIKVKEPEGFASLSEYLRSLGEEHFAILESDETSMKALYAFLAEGIFDERAGRRLHEMVESGLEQCGASLKYFVPDLSEEKLTEMLRVIDAHFVGMLSQWFLNFGRKECRASWAALSEMIIQYTGSRSPASQTEQ